MPWDPVMFSTAVSRVGALAVRGAGDEVDRHRLARSRRRRRCRHHRTAEDRVALERGDEEVLARTFALDDVGRRGRSRAGRRRPLRNRESLPSPASMTLGLVGAADRVVAAAAALVPGPG